MGQAIGRLSETPAVGGAAARPEPIGRWLARERKQRGLTLDEVASATRIPRRSLERLEAGAFDRNPDGFTRGFVRAVAEAIGLDPIEAQARVLPELAPPRGARAPVGALLWLALALALAAGLIAAAVPLWRSAASREAGPAAAAPDAQRRHDYVRDLAVARGARSAGGRAPAEPLPAPLAPVPPAPEPTGSGPAPAPGVGTAAPAAPPIRAPGAEPAAPPSAR